MLIRSQDKKNIVNLDNIDTICIMKNRVQYFNGAEESMGELGEYSTEEKAIKVLDMIQEEYLETTEIYHGDYVTKCRPRAVVFQMPQDSEV